MIKKEKKAINLGEGLIDLFEFYLLYDICDNYSANILKVNLREIN